MASARVYVDTYASIGMHGPTDARVRFRVSELLSDMDHAGITAALVYHWIAREYDPMYGNMVLLEEIAEHRDRLFPVWVLQPDATREMDHPEQVVEQMKAHGVVAARMFPRRHGFAFSMATCGPLLSALSTAGIPLMMDVGRYGDDHQATLGEIDEIAAALPHLAICLQAARWEDTREVVALLRRRTNCYIEFSSFQIHYGPEFLKERIGVDRLLLGTGWPFKSPGAARSLVDYCELEESDRTAFASGNARRLFNLPTLTARSTEDASPILRRVKAGLPIDHIPVIDPHTHVLHDGLMGSGYVTMPWGDAEHMIRRNRRLGIDRFCCSSWIGIWIDYARGNTLINDLQTRYPDDLIGYATIDPKKSADVAADIRLCHDTYGFRGIKPYHPRVGLPYNDPMYDAWYEKGNEIGAFVKLHQSTIGDNFLGEIDDISRRYPNMTYLLAHSGWTWEVARERAAFAKTRPNVMLDLTFTSVLHGVVAFFVEEGLGDRVLFCTDAPMRDPIQQLGWVAYSQVDEPWLEAALGGNALRVLAHAGLTLPALRTHYGLDQIG